MQSTDLPSDVPNSVKRIKNRRASSRQHTLAYRRAASRSKPPKTATGAKLAVVRIQVDSLAANPVACQCSLAFGCAEQREAHQKWCASSRQHTLPTSVRWITRSGSAKSIQCARGGLFNTP
nr:hypothetical protein [Methylomarinum sp. Ch1-1]MDP4520292.1 hypothetical protein [Methylomarinum sp. Ch1-1]